MTPSPRLLISMVLVGAAIAAAPADTQAQPRMRRKPVPVTRDHRGPQKPPPAPRAEKYAAKAGHVWVGGHWDWKADKWDWTPGHFERERAGKSWQPGKWVKRGDVYAWIPGRWIAGGGGPAHPGGGPGPGAPAPYPNAAPPPPRAEKYAKRAGHVWVGGHWDWKAGKWDWVPGHFERERRNKEWRPGKWEKRGNRWTWVAGGWIAAAPAPVAAYPNAAPPPPRNEKYGTRRGFVWAPGHWDWKNGKWDWVPGHFERERANKEWRPGKWEKRGDRWTWVAGGWIAAAPAAYPNSAPPPPRNEKYGARRGFVWVAGRWDWKNGKWDWVPGHMERERRGKQWRPGKWEKRGDRWSFTAGGWIDGGSAEYPTAAPPPPRNENYAARRGFVWVAGRWDWKNGKWDWVPGHMERERRGKHWRAGRWEKNGDRWSFTAGAWIDGGASAYPTAAPPPPRNESYAPRRGFVWVAGRWDWKDGKWDWVPGHMERERAGRQWRPGRWDRDGDHYRFTAGEWVEAGAPGPGPEIRDHHRREWKLERPVVGSYWPIKGKAGSRIVIRGRNFPDDAIVLWNGNPIRGARVRPNHIAFFIPRDAATSGAIAVRTSRRDLPVGTFEVAADFDAAAELKKQEEERRQAALAAVKARNAKLAANRAARRAAIRKRIEERIASRDERRRKRLEEIRARWQNAFLADPEVQDELTLHAQRSADLARMSEIADLKGDSKAAVRIEVARQREDARHDRRMDTLKANFKGGAR